MTNSSGVEELKALASLINLAVDTIAKEQPDFPSLYDVAPERVVISLSNTLNQTLMASKQLIATLDPQYSVMTAFGVHVPSCLRVVIEAHIVEGIKELESTPGQGIHVDSLARFSSIDPKKLARVLRLLASQHFFREISLDTFTNTRASLQMDTGKKASEIKDDPLFYKDTDGIAAIISVIADESEKGSASLSEVLLAPKTSHSYAGEDSPASVAINHGLPYFDYVSKNPAMVVRFANAMKTLSTNLDQNPHSILGGFYFKTLPTDGVVVDVGGGIGQVSIILAKHLPPSVKIVLQDRAEVVAGETQDYCEKECPQDLASGRLTLRGHDFFEAQSVTADVYLLRAIIHDWPDHDAVRILKALKAVAKATTRLVIIDSVAGVLYPDLATQNHTLPFPLLPFNDFVYKMDLQMLTSLNALERTAAQFIDLGAQAGWIIEQIHPSSVGFSQMVFKLAGTA